MIQLMTEGFLFLPETRTAEKETLWSQKKL